MPPPPLRVAVDATPLFGARTGVGVFTAELLEGLGARTDLAVSAYAATWRGRGQLPGLVPPGVRPVRRPMAARPLRVAWSRLALPRIEWWTGPVDVVHGPNYVVPPTRGTAVVSVHDLTPVRFPELCTRDTLAFPGLIQAAVDRGAWVHTGSEFVAEEIREHFRVDAERVVSVHDGVEPVADGDPARGRELAGSDRYVLALGTIEPRKDYPSLIRAFDTVAADHPEVRLVVVGQDGWGVEAFDEAVAGARARSAITRLTFVSNEDRDALLRGATVFAYPSIYEGFGFPPLEAMTAGVPVVTTTAGSLPEIVGDAAVLVPPRDVDALAGALGELLDDEQQRARLADAGRAWAGRFTWSASVDGIVELYRSASSA